jgi:hypothetical protein
MPPKKSKFAGPVSILLWYTIHNGRNSILWEYPCDDDRYIFNDYAFELLTKATRNVGFQYLNNRRAAEKVKLGHGMRIGEWLKSRPRK